MPDSTQTSPQIAIDAPLPPEPRRYGAINWVGLWTLYKREVGRFLKVWMQTLFAPVVTTVLFMTVFKLAFGDRGQLYGDFEGLNYNTFLAPGLIVMSVLQNAFQNSSSSLTIAKVQGSQVDFLMRYVEIAPDRNMCAAGKAFDGASERLVPVLTIGQAA